MLAFSCIFKFSAKNITLVIGRLLILSRLAAYVSRSSRTKAEREVHQFTYSLYPHTGDFRQGGTVAEGYKLNIPLLARTVGKTDGAVSDNLSLVCADKENIVIETIKKAENDDSIIVRLYDAYNCKTNAKITLGFDFKKAYICDMLENNVCELETVGNTVTVPVNNYEIITLKFAR